MTDAESDAVEAESTKSDDWTDRISLMNKISEVENRELQLKRKMQSLQEEICDLRRDQLTMERAMNWDREIYTLNVDTFQDVIGELLGKQPLKERLSIKDFIERYPTIKVRTNQGKRSGAGT